VQCSAMQCSAVQSSPVHCFFLSGNVEHLFYGSPPISGIYLYLSSVSSVYGIFLFNLY
jgi:hypothetical protein